MIRFATVSMILTMGLALSSLAAEREPATTVSGKAEKKVKPDIAYVTLYAQVDGILMVDAVKKADAKVGEIISAINTQTNIVKDITVIDIALGEKQSRYMGMEQKEEAARPQITRRIRISCGPTTEGIYELIDRAIRAGALLQTPSMSSYSDDIRSVVIYGLENSAAAVDSVRQSAMDDAKVKAKQLADLAGKKVGGVVTVGSSGSSSFGSSVRIMGRTADFPTEYVGANSEAISISQTVSVTFELKD
jgi:uncharacterized protein YggE